MDVETIITTLLFLSLFGLNSSYRTHIFVNEKKNWKDAQEHCRKHYDDLSTITSLDIEIFCRNSKIPDDFFFCGLQRDIQNSGWMWSNGEPATINEWDTDQGSDPGENCAAIRKSTKKLHDYGCEGKLTFYCMTDLDLILETKTWDEALDYCIERNTTLASMNSSTIMDLAVNMAENALTVNVWTGLRFLMAHWFWVNGGDLEYKVWSNEAAVQCPAMNQRCGALDRDRRVWNPKNCQERLNFFCSIRRR
uniref:C-type lectin domain-containing protein n=1 Tax=Sinocyclocheilus grahami TaxID=75366 RepID=A0A672QZA9_SINGR